MAEYKQLRIQLSFRSSKPDQQYVYQYLKNFPEKTDYIVSLVMKDLMGNSAPSKSDDGFDTPIVNTPVAAPPPMQPPEIDYGKLAETLRPTLNDMVNQSLRSAFSGFMGMPATPERAPDPTPAAKVKKQEEDDNLSLALEGLEAFGLGRGGGFE